MARHHSLTGIWGSQGKGFGRSAIRAGAAQNALKPSGPPKN
jgi:hypothetical protein